MQRFCWPDYEIQLLGELQKQQNNAQFCDTLLQTEGISVPTHSCILAALSPYLSQKLSASPSPPLGQKRQLQLQAVKAQTLLKLVGLLYSGELEVNGSIEQNDVLSAARQFGIANLVEGQKGGSCREKEEAGRERNVSRKMQDAQVQAEMAGRGETDSPTKLRRCVSTGTQTVRTGEKTVGCSFTHSSQAEHRTPEPASPGAQNLDFSVPSLSQYICSTPCPPISSMHSTAWSYGESTLDRSFESVTKPTSTSALYSSMMSFPISLNDDSNSPTPQEDSACQQSSESGDSIQVLAKERTGVEDGKTNGNTADDSENTEQPSHSNRDEMLGEEKRNSAEKRHAHVGMKSLAKMKQMKQMMETTQISVKVKLRRTTKGEVWEVVNMQGTDETLSVLTSRKQHGSNHMRPQMDLTNSEAPPSPVQPGPIHKPEILILQPATTNSPEPPPHLEKTSDFQLLSRDCIAPNQNDCLESVPLTPPPGPMEECDEQIEKLLDDIMMGLNILPSLERDCMKSQCLQPNHDGAPPICQVSAAENKQLQSRMHAAVSAAGCAYDQDFGTQIGDSSTETAQNQPSCSSLSSVQPDAALFQQQQQQRSPQYHSFVTSMEQRDTMSHQGMPLSESQTYPYPEAPTTRSVIPTAVYSSGQKLPSTLTYYPACQEPSSQGSQNILEFLPLTNGNGTQSSHSLPCTDDLRLPRCLSPLEPSTSAAKHQPALNSSVNQSDKIQPQASLLGRPWLTVNPGQLQFPFSAIPHRAKESASLPRDTGRSCWSKQWQKHAELNPQNGGNCEASCVVMEVEERGVISAGHQNVAELKSDPRKMMESLKCKRGDTNGDAADPKQRKRKRRAHPQETSPLLAYKHVKVSDGTKGHINLSVCSVSLSSNNVLAKEREMTTSSSNMLNKYVEKTNEPSTITESGREKARGPGRLSTDRTRIRTRGFLKKTQETPSSSSIEDSVLKLMSPRAQIAIKQRVPGRGRGRPRKTKLEGIPPESSAAITEIMSHNVNREQHIDSNLLKEESEKAKRRCKKRRRDRSEVEAVPLKKTISAKSTVKAEAGDNDDVIPAGGKVGIPKQPRMVTLKEFQKIIKHRHSKTRKSKESQVKETNESVRDVESEGKVCGGRSAELTKETDMDIDIAQPQNRDWIEESHVPFNATVDKNHNQIFNGSTAEYGKWPQDDTDTSTSKETSLFGDECSDVFGEEGAKLAAEREQPLQNPDEAGKACDAGVSDATQQTAVSDGGLSHSDTHLPQEGKMPLDHDLNPQTPERTGPPLSNAVDFSKSSGCDQEEAEEGDVEVDILLYSPDKVPQTGECENGLDNMVITPEEEEEEDVNEIDVTGDEAE